MVTRSQIETVLLRTDTVGMHAVGRALVHLYNRQTADEKVEEDTRHSNERGFRPCHARMGSNMATFYLDRGYLSPKQVAYWQRPANPHSSRSKPRITIYVRQLLEEALNKAQLKAL